MPNPFLSLAMVACFDGEQPADETIPVDTSAEETQDAPPVEPVEATEAEPPEPEPLFSVADVEQQIAERLAAAELEWKSQLTAKDGELNDIRSKFSAATIERTLTDAIVAGDGVSVEQVMPLLKPYSRVDSHGNVIVEVEGFTLSASEAVHWMRAQVGRYGNLFRSNLIPGLGSHSAAGGARAGKPVDVRHMSAEQYRAVRKENPSVLGLGGVG